jgi:DNA modification methylase
MGVKIHIGDCRDILRTLPDESVHCCVTSPPYFGLRDYGVDGQIGQETTPEEYVSQMVDVFREVRRVLRADGTLWLNLGDSYANDGKWGGSSSGFNINTGPTGGEGNRKKRQTGLKPKDLIGIPWMVAFALRADGWWLRQDIVWHKPSTMPESVTDRCTKSHEYIFLLSKSERYHFDADAIREPASSNGRDRRNKRSVWTVPAAQFRDAHFATFPADLIVPCILAGCPLGGVVLDPFGGAGTTGLVCDKLGRSAVLIELNPEYAAMAERRISRDAPLLSSVSTTAHTPVIEAA